MKIARSLDKISIEYLIELNSDLVVTANAVYSRLDKRTEAERNTLGFYDVIEPTVPSFNEMKQKLLYTDFVLTGDKVTRSVSVVDLSLADVQVNAKTEMSRRYEEERLAGFMTTADIKLDCDKNASIDMLAKLSLFDLLAIPDTHTESVMDYDNLAHEKTKVQIIELFKEVINHIDDLKIAKWGYRQEIDAATLLTDIPEIFAF